MKIIAILYIDSSHAMVSVGIPDQIGYASRIKEGSLPLEKDVVLYGYIAMVASFLPGNVFDVWVDLDDRLAPKDADIAKYVVANHHIPAPS